MRLEDHMSSIPSKHLQTAAQIAFVREAAVNDKRIVVPDKRQGRSVERENDHVLTVLEQVVEVVALTTII